MFHRRNKDHFKNNAHPFSFFCMKPKRSRRKRFSFLCNKAASLSIQESIKDKILDVHAHSEISKLSFDQLTLEKIEALKQQIVEHAARRVDLFFYLVIALRNTDCFITRDKTFEQFGCGSENRGTEACHSAFIPNIKMQKLLPGQILSKNKFSLLSGTHLETSLNSTIELPGIVNSLDRSLEGKYGSSKWTYACMDILNQISRGKINPIEAMNQFYMVMNDFFNSTNWYFFKKQNKDVPLIIKKRIHEYEKKGTFLSANNDLTFSLDYLYLMLRLTPAEIQNVKNHPESIDEYYYRVQKEIFTSKESDTVISATKFGCA